MPIPSHLPPWYCAYVTGRGIIRRHVAGSVPASQHLLRLAAQHVIGATVSGPVCSFLEVGATVVTAPAPTGRLPAPPRYSRNAYGPRDLRPVEWYSQPWYFAPREVLP